MTVQVIIKDESIVDNMLDNLDTHYAIVEIKDPKGK